MKKSAIFLTLRIHPYRRTLYFVPVIQNLIKKGHHVAETPSFGLVNVVGCLQGLTNDMNSCEVATDPRGFGLAVKIHD